MYWHFLWVLFLASLVMPFAFALLSLPGIGVAYVARTKL